MNGDLIDKVYQAFTGKNFDELCAEFELSNKEVYALLGIARERHWVQECQRMFRAIREEYPGTVLTALQRTCNIALAQGLSFEEFKQLLRDFLAEGGAA